MSSLWWWQVSFTSRGWAGLEHNTGPDSLLDGSVDTSTWFYAIGSSGAWSCGIPGANDCEEVVELYALWGVDEAPAPPPSDFAWRPMLRQTAPNVMPPADWQRHNAGGDHSQEDFSVRHCLCLRG